MELLARSKLRIFVVVSAVILLGMILVLYSKNALPNLVMNPKTKQTKRIKSHHTAAKRPKAMPSRTTQKYNFNKSNSTYIVTLTYNSQMTRAIRNLMGQQCFTRSMVGLSASIVEPFSYESKLVHSKKIWDDMKTNDLHSAVLFEDYFDLSHFNKVSLSENSSPLLKWKDFVSRKRSPQKLVTVILPSHKCSFGNSVGAELKNSKQKRACPITKTFAALIQGLKDRFSISSVNSVCLECSELSHRLSIAELKTMIFGNDTDFSKYIVLTNTWRNFAFTEGWLEIPSDCKVAENPKSERLKSSTSVAKHSKAYETMFIKSQHTIAVMFRIERFLTLKVLGKSNESLESCIKKTVNLHDKLKQDHPDSGTFITLDIGRFGSKLMMTNDSVSKYGQDSLQSIQESVESLVQNIYKGQFKSMEDYEESFVKATDGVSERGYISMVQRSIATGADCLVLMGGGSYQQVAISQYLALHPNKKEQCIHAVCVADNVSNMLPKHS